ncbi:MAG: radical SAM protein [Firmicutes bacterium]|nr:radical SAM protein [Bacillota bacterium]
MYKIRGLNHGGIMVNYECNAACRHCLYACSPDRLGGYMTTETATEICQLLQQGNCRSVHIGGGEPFLDFDALMEVLQITKTFNIKVDYVETNAFWAKDSAMAKNYLKALKTVNVDTICISLDPFHAEYIPFSLPLRLAEICKQNNFGYFLWQERFLQSLARVAPTKAHDRKSLEETISPDYIRNTAKRYGLSMGGRAINIEEEYEKPQPIDNLIQNQSTCRHLISSDHFHVDLFCNFVPPGCTGMAIPFAEIINGVEEGKYPAYEALMTGGIEKLLTFAKNQGFTPKNEYTSKCDLCFRTREWLSKNANCPELTTEHYEASLTYYN